MEYFLTPTSATNNDTIASAIKASVLLPVAGNLFLTIVFPSVLWFSLLESLWLLSPFTSTSTSEVCLTDTLPPVAVLVAVPPVAVLVEELEELEEELEELEELEEVPQLPKPHCPNVPGTAETKEAIAKIATADA